MAINGRSTTWQKRWAKKSAGPSEKERPRPCFQIARPAGCRSDTTPESRRSTPCRFFEGPTEPDRLETTLTIALLLIVIVLFFEFSNGFNDCANMVVTPVITGALEP